MKLGVFKKMSYHFKLKYILLDVNIKIKKKISF